MTISPALSRANCIYGVTNRKISRFFDAELLVCSSTLIHVHRVHPQQGYKFPIAQCL